jgi:hypothetical protein
MVESIDRRRNTQFSSTIGDFLRLSLVAKRAWTSGFLS